MLPFLLPLLMGVGGAGIGALKNKKNPLKGALIGGGLGALGGAGLGAMGVGGGAAAAGTSGIGPFASAAKYGSALKGGALGGLKSHLTMSNLQNAAKLMGSMQAQPQMDDPMQLRGMDSQPNPIASLGSAYTRPMAPPVETSIDNMPVYGPRGRRMNPMFPGGGMFYG